MGTAERDGVRLAWQDFGGVGPAVVLLHGLAGHAEEWAGTATWLTKRARVVALDVRGHGHSELLPEDVSRAALVADVAYVIDTLGLAPVVAVGQSFGGLTALSLAARHPALVRGVVLVEATPEGGDANEASEAAATVGAGLRSWPVPFASLVAASDYFADRYGSGEVGAAWAAGLEERPDGLWPRFDAGVLERMLAEGLSLSSWSEWERLSVPALVVRGERGIVDGSTATRMLERLPRAELREIQNAGHDAHLEQPRAWEAELTAFLDGLSLPAQRKG
jgi:pimeloyl-ACP methyl ester carboxylesterase